MAIHHFRSKEDLRAFWAQGRGYLLNNAKNCLHETTCSYYRGNPPSLTYTRQGFDTSDDAVRVLRDVDTWYPCPNCNPRIDLALAQNPPSSVNMLKWEDTSGPATPVHGSRAGAMLNRPMKGAELLDARFAREKAEAIQAFDTRYGEMERVLWTLACHCRAPLMAGVPTEAVETLVWTIKSWWGVQGVPGVDRARIAHALASMEWTADLFESSLLPPREGSALAVELVSEAVMRSKELGAKRQEYSLLSKVLHWLLPWRVPVYDGFVHATLGLPTGRQQPEPYRGVARILLEAANETAEGDLSWLGSSEPRSVLRGLDKWLWWRGGGNADTAMIVRDPGRVLRPLGLSPE